MNTTKQSKSCYVCRYYFDMTVLEINSTEKFIFEYFCLIPLLC